MAAGCGYAATFPNEALVPKASDETAATNYHRITIGLASGARPMQALFAVNIDLSRIDSEEKKKNSCRICIIPSLQ